VHPSYQHIDSPLPFVLSVDRPHNLCTRFANMAIADRKPRNSSKNKHEQSIKKVCPKLLHRRLGHLSIGALTMASDLGLWSDTIIRTDTDPFCYSCKLGGRMKSA
jgi:hypothetical protein